VELNDAGFVIWVNQKLTTTTLRKCCLTPVIYARRRVVRRQSLPRPRRFHAGQPRYLRPTRNDTLGSGSLATMPGGPPVSAGHLPSARLRRMTTRIDGLDRHRLESPHRGSRLSGCFVDAEHRGDYAGTLFVVPMGLDHGGSRCHRADNRSRQRRIRAGSTRRRISS
jgi:hypothetical protein